MLQFESNGDPVVAQIVSSRKDLQVFTIWNQCLNKLIDLLGLLRLSSSLAEDDV